MNKTEDNKPNKINISVSHILVKAVWLQLSAVMSYNSAGVLYLRQSQLTHMQVFPLISGSDKCRGSRNGGGSLDSRQNETEQPLPQTL